MKFELEQLINHVNFAVDSANNGISKLPNDILRMEGMSGIKTRHLYNNICGLTDANYLEIGTWKGSSFVSALYHNNINAVAIDNWFEFNGPKNQFIENVTKFCPNSKYNFIENDCFNLSKEELNLIDDIDIYLYDGAHDYESQRKAITYYKNQFSKYIILIIDDFRSDTPAWQNVKKGTLDGIEESGLIIHHSIELLSHQESSGGSDYWNGCGLFILENQKK